MSATLPCRSFELPFGRLAVMPVQPAEALFPWLAEEDLTTALRFGNASRRAGFLSWRAVARALLGPDTVFDYDAVGAPVLRNRPLHLGVSHSNGYVAVVCGERPCAVDTEPTDRDFSRALSRVLAPHETAWAVDSRSRAALWCAKETLYKLAGEKGLDLRDDLRIERFALPLIEGRAKSNRCLLVWQEWEGQTIVCGTTTVRSSVPVRDAGTV